MISSKVDTGDSDKRLYQIEQHDQRFPSKHSAQNYFKKKVRTKILIKKKTINKSFDLYSSANTHHERPLIGFLWVVSTSNSRTII